MTRFTLERSRYIIEALEPAHTASQHRLGTLGLALGHPAEQKYEVLLAVRPIIMSGYRSTWSLPT